MPVTVALAEWGRGGVACAGLVEVAHQVRHAFRLRVQAQDVHPQRAQRRQFRAEVGEFLAQHLDAVDAQERAASQVAAACASASESPVMSATPWKISGDW